MSELTIIESVLKDKQYRLSQFSQAVIDGLEVAEIKYSQITYENRYDSEFFFKNYSLLVKSY